MNSVIKGYNSTDPELNHFEYKSRSGVLIKGLNDCKFVLGNESRGNENSTSYKSFTVSKVLKFTKKQYG
jgi:hypothetical protein